MLILINTISTKKHSGGAYQIAYNFIVKSLEHKEVDWIYVVSKDLDEILPEPMKEAENYYVFPTQPDFKHSYKQVKIKLAALEDQLKPDIVYSITAPSYFTFKTKEVMRFTMPWVTHPNKYSWSVLSMKERIKMRIYCWNQRRLIRKARFFVTQTETTKQGIIRITGVNRENVKVVPNVLPAVFKAFPTSPFKQDGDWIDIACVGNPSAHKNMDIIPYVLVALREQGVENVRFHVTIPPGEVWNKMRRRLIDIGMKDRVVTHGRCSQGELSELYRHCQLCFLPTLLEVFSASPLEAMFFNLPIVATNFNFNREVMDDACLYYEPRNANDAARKIKEYVDSPALQQEMKVKMSDRLQLFNDYDKHFNDILYFLKSVSNR